MAFWADKVVDRIQEDLKETIASKEGGLVVRDEKTASGHPHIGSLIGVAIHHVVMQVLRERDIKATFHYEINDTDPMDGLPAYLDASVYKGHMGKPLSRIPAPDGSTDSLADYFGRDFMETIKKTGYTPTFYKTSELYNSGRMNDVIRLALTHADTIRDIYKKISGSVKSDDWLPFHVICEKCGKVGTTKAISFDGEQVTYVCEKDMVEWAEGCGHEGSVSPFDGNGTLPWKVEWAAKFKVMNVDVEGAGKDHSTKGGARDVARHIAEKVFEYKNPFDIPYEFFLVGGKKMSSSKGNATTAKEFADLLPPNILKLALVGRDINKQTNFDPERDSVPILYDKYDKIAEKYWAGTGDDDARIFEIIHVDDVPRQHFLPRFSQIAFLVQMPHMDVEEEVAKLKGEVLTDIEKEEVSTRAEYAKRWLDRYAPESYIFKIQDSLPERTKAFNEKQKEALAEVLRYIDTHEKLDGQELHTKLHEIRSEVGIEPKDFFSAIYIAFLDKDSGPKAGWFLSVLDRKLLLDRFAEVTK